MMDSLLRIIKLHEGYRPYAYRDTVGKLTIGIGRNIDDVGLSQEEAEYLLKNDVIRCMNELNAYQWFRNLDDVRQGVMTELCFNVGLTKLLLFRKTIEALENKNYVIAAKEMLSSKWAKQVGARRSNDMAMRLLNGKYE